MLLIEKMPAWIFTNQTLSIMWSIMLMQHLILNMAKAEGISENQKKKNCKTLIGPNQRLTTHRISPDSRNISNIVTHEMMLIFVADVDSMPPLSKLSSFFFLTKVFPSRGKTQNCCSHLLQWINDISHYGKEVKLIIKGNYNAHKLTTTRLRDLWEKKRNSNFDRGMLWLCSPASNHSL